MYTLIKRIYDGIAERLTDSYYGKKIMAAYLAYGGNYEFCRFYACDGGGYYGTVHMYNSSMVIDGKCSPDDVRSLVEMTKPVSVEIACGSVTNNGYAGIHRTLFMGIPEKTDITAEETISDGSFAECYDILNESFENFGSFDDWYVDISHRIRHGVSDIYLYRSTTVTKCFDIDDLVFVSGIATAAKNRGKGSAGKFLKYLAGKFEKEGKKMCLFALDHRKTFYESIGFVPVGEDILYEWKGE